MINSVQTVGVEKVAKLLFSLPVKDNQWGGGLEESQYRTVFFSHPSNNNKMDRG